MSSASYAAWAKFDVEKELERVDAREQRDAQHKQQQRQVQAKERVESSATQEAQQSADVLAAQAAVAALKAKKRKGRDKKNSGRGADESVEKAAKLQTQAALFAHKHELLQQIMENRRLGDRILEEKGWEQAKKLFEKALSAVKKLEEVAPQLLQAEEEQARLLGKEPSNQLEKKHEKSHDHAKQDAEDGHSCGQSCSHEKKADAVKKAAEPLPKADDLMAIVKMFYKDVYMGIGTCDLAGDRLAAATEAFKEVLLRDDVHLSAWLKRGEAFERMDAPLLAMLHYSRITNLDSDHVDAMEALERVKTKLLTEGDASSDKNAIQSAVSRSTEGHTFREVLERIEWVFEEANVLVVENFYDYSTTKYQVVLGCIEALRARAEIYAANEETASSVIAEIEMSCHLNIASGCLEMQRNYTMALSHCEQALRLDSNRAISHFRTGQLYHALHSYEKALECFESAKALVSAVATGQSQEQRKKMLATIVKETDKCEFDRSQYDMGYLRSMAAK
uniref:peptidylprolyl isomerase n=1 Tax=Phytophthora ramorum TaxID=164328 RepID=H3GEK9_PHYRM